jgi:soluble lytic murein transglycosylase-like protein
MVCAKMDVVGKMKNKWILFLLFLILTTPLCIMWVNNIRDKVEIKRIEYIKDKKIECMTKTLMILYGISKWEARYYSIIFFDFSENYKIPWEIYPAIIRIESNFRTNLTSDKKAKGLMQVLESTASEECKLLGIKYVNDRTLWNDICNIVIGCNYLSRMIKENGIEDGIKAYLGGPGILKSKNISVENNRYIKE